MSIYLDEKNPGKHKPFDDAAPDIVEYVRYLEVIAGKSANTAFSYYCDLRGFSRFMKRRRGLVPEDSEMKDIDPKGLDTAFWASVTKEDIYEYLYFLNRECGNKKSSTARRLASLHGFYDYLVNQVNRLDTDPTAAIHPPKQDKVLPKYLSLISDTCGCEKMSQPYSCGINAMRKEVLCFIKLNIKKERIRKWRRSSGCYFRNRDWQSGKSRSVYAMKCWILC